MVNQLGRPQHELSTKHTAGGGTIQALKSLQLDGEGLWGSPDLSASRWCGFGKKCTPLLSCTMCFQAKCQWVFQIKMLKMYEQQLSHGMELITLVGLFSFWKQGTSCLEPTCSYAIITSSGWRSGRIIKSTLDLVTNLCISPGCLWSYTAIRLKVVNSREKQSLTLKPSKSRGSLFLFWEFAPTTKISFKL